MCGAAPCALSASMLSHFSIARNVSGPHFFWNGGAFSASIAAPYSIQPFSARTAGTLARKAVRISSRLPGLAVMTAMTWIIGRYRRIRSQGRNYRGLADRRRRAPKNYDPGSEFLDEREVLRRGAGEDARERLAIEAIDAREEPAEERAVLVQHGIVTVLEKRVARDAQLLARDAAAAQAAAERPVHRAVAVIGAAVAVLAEGAAELAHHQHHRVAPRIAHRSRERGEAAAELVEPRREIALRAAFADVRVPAADVDEAQAIVAAHEPGDALCLRLEGARGNGVAARRDHLVAELAHHRVARGE